MTSSFNQKFPASDDLNITSVKKHENFNKQLVANDMDFSHQKTLQLIKTGKLVGEIATLRGIKEGTVWQHIAYLIENHQLTLKSIVSINKVRKILTHIKSRTDTLKEIKDRCNDGKITYNKINCVLANLKGKSYKKNIVYFVEWYQRTNCFRKCYLNKKQREACRIKFQVFISKMPDIKFTKDEFLDFFNNNVNICVLPDKDKRRFMSWQEFNKSKKSR